MPEQVTVETLKDFLEAFNRHDLDSIMSYFADDCIFYMPRGARPRGDKYVGKAEVRAGLASRFEGIPDVHYGNDQHWICGDLGVSEYCEQIEPPVRMIEPASAINRATQCERESH